MAMSSPSSPSSPPLLSVKHAVPPARTGTVERQRLVDRLDGSGDARLCVVVAPPGWGKTTLLSQWAAQPGLRGRVGWVSLDPSDDEPVRFWSYVLTALCGVAPEVARRALTTLSAPGIDPVTVTLPLLINDAAASDRQYVVVLDDVHVLHDRRLMESLEFLITYLPATLRLVLAGRADPALPVGRWRGRRQLIEVRAPELAFDRGESEALLAAVGVTDLDSSALGVLCQRTEGWAVGLHLAAQAVRSSPLPQEGGISPRLRGDDRHLFDYFETEILDEAAAGAPGVPRADFGPRAVVRSAVRCGARPHWLGRGPGQLEEASHFVSALDPGRSWYRCHGLFRDALRRELEDVRPRHERSPAGPRCWGWYVDEGQIDEAVRHLLRAGESVAALDLLKASQGWFLRTAEPRLLLPGQEAASTADPGDAEVFLMMAFAAAMRGSPESVRHWCDSAAPLLDADVAWRSRVGPVRWPAC